MDEYLDNTDLPSVCDPNDASTRANTTMFSCCLAETHPSRPRCLNSNDKVFYELEVVDWCLTEETSSVTVRAPVCYEPEMLNGLESTLPSVVKQASAPSDPTDNDRIQCFRLTSTDDDRMNFIVSFNPNEFANHGYMRRTAAQVDLFAGILTQSEIGTADDGLIATHGIFMLLAWMVVAPAAIFIVRYMKTSSWRVAAHVSLMGFTGSLMVPLLIGVEASVGASDKSQSHAVVGLSLMAVYFCTAFAGRIRYLKLIGRQVGRKADLISLLFHKFGGFAFVGAAWYNCYTGLVRIGPEDAYIQVVLGSTIPLGYEMPVFGFIQRYLFFPYIGFVCAIFVVAEIRVRLMNSSSHAEEMQAMLKGKSTIWDDVPSELLEKMTMDNFLEVTRMGTALCIVDRYVLDITDFTDAHPGGQHLLRYAKGSDITEEFVGLRDVDGLKNVHSRAALQLMKQLIVAVLVDDESPKSKARITMLSSNGPTQLANSEPSNQSSRGTMSVFRPGRIVALECLTPEIQMTSDCKPVILLKLALPSARLDNRQKWLTTLPSCAFTFRSVCGGTGSTVEREYTPVTLGAGALGAEKSARPSEQELSFIISLVPGGKMSTVLLDLKRGKSLLVKGPAVNPSTIQRFDNTDWGSVVMIAAGTGIAPMLQVIEFYLSSPPNRAKPRLFLLWIIKGPEYDYSQSLGLQQQVERSRGLFSFTVVYASCEADPSLVADRIRTGGKQGRQPSVRAERRHVRERGWNFQSLAKQSTCKPSWQLRKDEKVKRLVLQSSLKSSGTRNISTSKLEGHNESVLFPLSNDDRAFNKETWTGPTQYRSRCYNLALLREVLASVGSTERETPQDKHFVGHGIGPRDADETEFMTTREEDDDIFQFTQTMFCRNESGEIKPAPQTSLSGLKSAQGLVDGYGKVVSFAVDAFGPQSVSSNTTSDEKEPRRPSHSSLDKNNILHQLECDESIEVSGEQDLFSEAQPSSTKRMVAVSGTPKFEYETRMMLMELGVPRDQILAFHGASAAQLEPSQLSANA